MFLKILLMKYFLNFVWESRENCNIQNNTEQVSKSNVLNVY